MKTQLAIGTTALCLALLSPGQTQGQSADTSGLQDRADARGFKAESVFEVGEIDTVNLFNGNLTVNIPIGQQYSSNGFLKYGLTLSYNSSVWDLREIPMPNVLPCEPKGRCSPTSLTKAIPNPLSNAGLGWTHSLGSLHAPHTISQPPTTQQHTLNVVVTPSSGAGTILSTPPGITCGASPQDCMEAFPEGTAVALTVDDIQPGWYFVSWGEDCDSQGNVTMSASQQCTATFAQSPPPPGHREVHLRRRGASHAA